MKVVPLGVDVRRYRPEASPFRLRTLKRFKFLFVGGTIARKGIDVLLNAYTRIFTAGDDVCLVIKDFGAGSFYKGQTAEGRIGQCQAPSGAPEIEYIQRSLTEEELAGLYTACDCLVHPYRGEGFGLPIAEAMASGLAVVVTNHGAALDFCDETTAFLVPARVRQFRERRVGSFETVGIPYWAEPDQEALQRLMRHIWELGPGSKATEAGVDGKSRESGSPFPRFSNQERSFEETRARILREQRCEEQADRDFRKLKPSLRKATRLLRTHVRQFLKNAPTEWWPKAVTEVVEKLVNGTSV